MSPAILRCAAFVFATSLVVPCASAQTAEKALAAFKAGQWKEVFAAVEAVPAEAADRARALYLAGEAHLVVGQPAEAELAFRAVLAARTAAVPARIGLARALTAQDELDEAEQLLSELARSESKDLNVQHALGELQLRAGKLDAARKTLAAVCAAEPKNAGFARAHCDVLWALEDDAAAAKVAEKLAKDLPKHPMGPFLLAVTQERLGQDAKALESYEKALALDANFLDAHKNLAILCHTQNPVYQDAVRTEKSLAHYAKYFELGGRDPELQHSYEQFKGFMQAYAGQGKSKEPK